MKDFYKLEVQDPALCQYFTKKEGQRDTDKDSGMGPSISTDTKSSTISEVSYCIPPSIRGSVV